MMGTGTIGDRRWERWSIWARTKWQRVTGAVEDPSRGTPLTTVNSLTTATAVEATGAADRTLAADGGWNGGGDGGTANSNGKRSAVNRTSTVGGGRTATAMVY